MSSQLDELKLTALTATLKSCQLFLGVSSDDVRAICGFTLVKGLETGHYLFREGDPSQGFYVVQRGAINVHRVNSLGKEQVIHIFRTGESIAEATLATDSGYPADARAVEPSQVLLIQRVGFLDMLQRQPQLALRMLASMSLHLRVLLAQIEDLTMKDVETRLANWLLKRCPDLASDKPQVIELGITKRVLAAELGTVSETFSRTLAKFRDQGLVQVQGKRITVLSPARLASLLRKHLGE